MKNKIKLSITLDLKNKIELQQFYIFQKTFVGDISVPISHSIKRFGKFK